MAGAGVVPGHTPKQNPSFGSLTRYATHLAPQTQSQTHIFDRTKPGQALALRLRNARIRNERNDRKSKALKSTMAHKTQNHPKRTQTTLHPNKGTTTHATTSLNVWPVCWWSLSTLPKSADFDFLFERDVYVPPQRTIHFEQFANPTIICSTFCRGYQPARYQTPFASNTSARDLDID